jgi:hypothetical protein
MTTLTHVPIGVTKAWLAAVEAADCQCQCTAAVKGHTHARAGGRCPTTQGVNGGRLHMLADGTVACGPCANHREKTATKAKPGPEPGGLDQGGLFELPEPAGVNL